MKGSFAMKDNVTRKLFRPVCFLIFLVAVSLLAGPLIAGEMEKEIALGKKVAAEVEKRWESVKDPAQTARLGMILARLLPYTTRALPYEARIVRDDMINAFSLPGGQSTSPQECLNFCGRTQRSRRFWPTNSSMPIDGMS